MQSTSVKGPHSFQQLKGRLRSSMVSARLVPTMEENMVEALTSERLDGESGES